MIRLAIIALALVAVVPAQDCAARAGRTLDEALKLALQDKKAAALEQLATAERECPTHPTVLKRLAELYDILGEPERAAHFRRGPEPASGDSASGKSESARSVVREKWAIVAGVGAFKDAGIPALRYAAKDARDFAGVLSDNGVGRFRAANVRVLTDDAATLRGLRSALTWVAEQALADDLVVIYLATHGSNPAQDQSKSQSGYFLLHDSELADLAATSLGMDELVNQLQRKVRAERIVVFVDTCFSGDTARQMLDVTNRPVAGGGFEIGARALRPAGIAPESYERIAQGKGTAVITSSNNRELSWESAARGNGVFTAELIDALKKYQGKADLTLIFRELQRRVGDAAREASGGKQTQTPTIFPKDRIPDIIIGAPVQ